MVDGDVSGEFEDVGSLEFIPDGGCVLKDWQRVSSSFDEVVKSTRDSSTGVRPKCRFGLITRV